MKKGNTEYSYIYKKCGYKAVETEKLLECPLCIFSY